ncbi:cobalt-precorrin-5B (C(1))-methyltransferase [Acidisoma cellulosilyticum]|uniref:cobalt-precorrin-5B (C(1))-methyltransferase n=1 Tax=Acidisoma cellulosilyticum TaxID=2802395 RepID=UPI001D0A9274|nr:cobalt-precorrin-5B (C(1))-methyltransferase [Acidisoma cellulosilyticum]
MDTPSLRRGWTTGACATAAVRAAATALLTGQFPDPCTIRLPGGQTAGFALAATKLLPKAAMAAVVKDAGDDPDVTHGALIRATVSPGAAGSGITFRAGSGVGMVTLPGLPIPPGEPAINPVPRRMMTEALQAVSAEAGIACDWVVEIGVDDGERLAEKTLNPRLGIRGGLSILGTTGIVIPFSCSAWIDSIHRGIDVARALALPHVAAATGRTSEEAVQALYGLPEPALIDMGDFVGGTLKYLRRHPVPRVTIAGGPAKMTKLAQGRLDLHSKRGAVDSAVLANLARSIGADEALAGAIEGANTTLHAFELAANLPLAAAIAERAHAIAQDVLGDAPIALDILIFDRTGKLIARHPQPA